MRTLTGAEQFAALRSYLATTAKHNIDGLDALTRLTSGNPCQPQTIWLVTSCEERTNIDSRDDRSPF